MKIDKYNLPLLEDERLIQSFPVINYSLAALQSLSMSLLQEIEALRVKAKSQVDIIKEINDGKIDLEREVKKYEVELIRCALVQTRGRQRPAAKLLNIKISTLNSKIKRFGI